jgi:hypothetical protein
LTVVVVAVIPPKSNCPLFVKEEDCAMDPLPVRVIPLKGSEVLIVVVPVYSLIPFKDKFANPFTVKLPAPEILPYIAEPLLVG